MADLQAEWAGVLQRWGNSNQTGETSVTVTSTVTDKQSNYKKYDSHDRQSSNKYDSYDRQSSNKYDSHDRQSSNKYDSHERQSKKSDSEERQSGRRQSLRQEDSRTERQNTRDRQERESLAGGKTGGRPRWSSASRGSVSPGKENCETIGYR